ncbi:MAG: hypothetical protein OEZ36_01135 [Spirochaetota bacterium]|nr:hypothetical protein [Spirochaetota bacterium]
MMRLSLKLVIVIFFLVLAGCDDKNSGAPKANSSGKGKTNKELSPDELLNQINESSRDTDKSNAKVRTKSPAKKESKWPDDGSWALLIDDRKVARSVYEAQYQQFIRLSGQRVSREDYVNVFLQQHFITQRAHYYFSQSAAGQSLLNHVRRQAFIQTYLQQKVYNKHIKTPDMKTLTQFHGQLTAQKGYEHLSLSRHRAQIIKIYKLSKVNQNMMFLDQTLKGSFRISKNDEWEQDIISKYAQNKINMKQALGSGYRQYWLYKIYLDSKKSSWLQPKSRKISPPQKPGAEEKPKAGGTADSSKSIPVKDKPSLKPVDDKAGKKKAQAKPQGIIKKKPTPKKPVLKAKRSDKNAIIIYIRDIENYLNLMARMGRNYQLIRQFRTKPQVRLQLINRYLLEELVYLRLKSKGLLRTRAYQIKAIMAVNNFKSQYYLRNVLGLTSPEKKRNYFMDIISSHKIILSDSYFHPKKADDTGEKQELKLKQK